MPNEKEVSARLKAARWLYGDGGDSKAPKPLSTAALAEMPALKENDITKNRLEEIEQAKVKARPMELERIAEAMGLPPDLTTRGRGPVVFKHCEMDDCPGLSQPSVLEGWLPTHKTFTHDGLLRGPVVYLGWMLNKKAPAPSEGQRGLWALTAARSI